MVRPSERVGQHHELIRKLVAEHHAVAPRIFGSVARGEDGPESDVDLRVDVDVVAADGLRGEMREHVLREAVDV